MMTDMQTFRGAMSAVLPEGEDVLIHASLGALGGALIKLSRRLGMR